VIDEGCEYRLKTRREGFVGIQWVVQVDFEEKVERCCSQRQREKESRVHRIVTWSDLEEYEGVHEKRASSFLPRNLNLAVSCLRMNSQLVFVHSRPGLIFWPLSVLLSKGNSTWKLLNDSEVYRLVVEEGRFEVLICIQPFERYDLDQSCSGDQRGLRESHFFELLQLEERQIRPNL